MKIVDWLLMMRLSASLSTPLTFNNQNTHILEVAEILTTNTALFFFLDR